MLIICNLKFFNFIINLYYFEFISFLLWKIFAYIFICFIFAKWRVRSRRVPVALFFLRELLARLLVLFLKLWLGHQTGKGDAGGQTAHVHVALVMESHNHAALPQLVGCLHDGVGVCRVD